GLGRAPDQAGVVEVGVDVGEGGGGQVVGVVGEVAGGEVVPGDGAGPGGAEDLGRVADERPQDRQRVGPLGVDVGGQQGPDRGRAVGPGGLARGGDGGRGGLVDRPALGGQDTPDGTVDPGRDGGVHGVAERGGVAGQGGGVGRVVGGIVGWWG